MKIFFYLFLLISSLIYKTANCADTKPILGSTNIISFFIKEYPEKSETNNVDKVIKECSLLKRHFKTICQSFNVSHNFAVFSSYAGYLSMSNSNGQIIFPRKVINDSINLLVSNNIKPIFMFASNIAYWRIQDPNSKMYFFERIKDKDTKLFYWKTTEKELPASKRIPVQTIIVFADPKEIYVPIGITPTKANANLILPDIYVKNDINTLNNLLFVINMKPLFSNTKQIFKQIPLGYESLVVT